MLEKVLMNVHSSSKTMHEVAKRTLVEVEKANGFTFIDCDYGISIFQSDTYEIINCIFRNNIRGVDSYARTKLYLANNLFYNNHHT